jgi:hypothetical protein
VKQPTLAASRAHSRRSLGDGADGIRRWDSIVPGISMVLAAGLWLLTAGWHWFWWLAYPGIVLLLIGGNVYERHRRRSTVETA